MNLSDGRSLPAISPTDSLLSAPSFPLLPPLASPPHLQVCESLQMVPGRLGDFLAALCEFERGGGRSPVELFSLIRPVLQDWPDLLRDFAAFLHPDQAQHCGLVRPRMSPTGTAGLITAQFHTRRHVYRRSFLCCGAS